MQKKLMQKTVTDTVAAVAVTVAAMAVTRKEMLPEACRRKRQAEMWRKDTGCGGKETATIQRCGGSGKNKKNKENKARW